MSGDRPPLIPSDVPTVRELKIHQGYWRYEATRLLATSSRHLEAGSYELAGLLAGAGNACARVADHYLVRARELELQEARDAHP